MLKRLLATIWNHRAYNSLLESPQLLLPTGESLRVELKDLYPWTNGSAKGFSRYTFGAELSTGSLRCNGIGSSNIYGEAIQKAISEAYERMIYFHLKEKLNIKTSNGFAAHPNRKLAIRNACMEALERDAVLVHWLTKTPLLQLPLHHETKQGRKIELSLAGTPFSAKHLLLSTRGWISTLTIVAEERWGGGAIVAHGTGENLEHALTRTLAELERQAAFARDLLPHNPGFREKMDRILDHYTFSKERLAKAGWLPGAKISWHTAAKQWIQLTRDSFSKMKIDIMTEGALVVARASGEHLQDLYFGETNAADLNVARLGTGEINFDPHYVA